jgi:hypothetical protein
MVLFINTRLCLWPKDLSKRKASIILVRSCQVDHNLCASSLAACSDLLIHQMDVKTTFLNGELDEDIYIYIYEAARGICDTWIGEHGVYIKKILVWTQAGAKAMA